MLINTRQKEIHGWMYSKVRVQRFVQVNGLNECYSLMK